MKGTSIRKIALLLVIVLITVMAFSGCNKDDSSANANNNNNNNNNNSSSSKNEKDNVNENDSKATNNSQDNGDENVDVELKDWEIDTSPITLEQFFYASWGTFYPWQEDQYVPKVITEATGVTADIIIPTGNDTEYLNVMIAGGDLPDIMVLEWYNPITKKLIDNDMVYSINELSEKYAPNLMSMIPQDIINYHGEDGVLHYIPSFFNSKEAYEKAEIKGNGVRPFFVRQDIYEELGSPKMTTPEEWVSVLKEVKEKYPEIEPFGMEAPISPADAWDSNPSFSEYFPQIFNPDFCKGQYEGDRLLISQRTDGYKEAIKFMNLLYREDLFSQELFTDKLDQYLAKLNTGSYFLASRFVRDMWQSVNPKVVENTGDENKQYVFTEDVLLTVDGKDPVFASSSGAGWVCTLVSKDSENPDRAIRYLEYLWSDEGQMANFFGKEGETYEMVDGAPRFLPEILEERAKDPDAFAVKYGFEQKALLWRSEFNDLYSQALSPKEQIETSKILSNYTIFSAPLGLDGINPSGGSDEDVIRTKN